LKKKSKLSQKNWEIIRTKFDIDGWNWEKQINKKPCKTKKKLKELRLNPT
jgi:hypothetical protein